MENARFCCTTAAAPFVLGDLKGIRSRARLRNQYVKVPPPPTTTSVAMEMPTARPMIELGGGEAAGALATGIGGGDAVGDGAAVIATV